MTHAVKDFYLVKVYYLDILDAEVEKMNKRARRLGRPEMRVSILGYETKIEKRETRIGDLRNVAVKYAQVTIEGDIPRVDGWQLVAALTPQDNGEILIRSHHGEHIPGKYRESDPRWCEHCLTNRFRKDVFILRNQDDQYIQVGRNCLADFIRTGTPEQILAYAANFGKLSQIAGEMEEGGYGGGRRGPDTCEILEFLILVAICIRKCGWVSRKMVQEQEGGQSTAGFVWDILFNNSAYFQEYLKKLIAKIGPFEPSERDTKMAQDALDWARTIPADSGSDYMYNLGVAARQEIVTHQTMGLLASLVAAYQREMGREAERKAKTDAQQESAHIGAIGQRLIFCGITLTMIRQFETQYGVSTMLKFLDESGNIIVWFKSGELPDGWAEGDKMNIKATVKKHDEFRDQKQTIVTRATRM